MVVCFKAVGAARDKQEKLADLVVCQRRDTRHTKLGWGNLQSYSYSGSSHSEEKIYFCNQLKHLLGFVSYKPKGNTSTSVSKT